MQFMGAATNNFRIPPASPCVNAGVPLSWMMGATDLRGQARIQGGFVDMGAYEAAPKGTVFVVH